MNLQMIGITTAKGAKTTDFFFMMFTTSDPPLGSIQFDILKIPQINVCAHILLHAQLKLSRLESGIECVSNTSALSGSRMKSAVVSPEKAISGMDSQHTHLGGGNQIPPYPTTFFISHLYMPKLWILTSFVHWKLYEVDGQIPLLDHSVELTLLFKFSSGLMYTKKIETSFASFLHLVHNEV
ncbi:hypothetical protein ACJX0J_022445, partial [Zea mays]